MDEKFYPVATPEDHVPGIPSAERIWTEYRTRSGEMFWMTTKRNDPGMFYLYKDESGRAAKLGKGESPVALEKRFINIRGKS